MEAMTEAMMMKEAEVSAKEVMVLAVFSDLEELADFADLEELVV